VPACRPPILNTPPATSGPQRIRQPLSSTAQQRMGMSPACTRLYADATRSAAHRRAADHAAKPMAAGTVRCPAGGTVGRLRLGGGPHQPRAHAAVPQRHAGAAGGLALGGPAAHLGRRAGVVLLLQLLLGQPYGAEVNSTLLLLMVLKPIKSCQWYGLNKPLLRRLCCALQQAHSDALSLYSVSAQRSHHRVHTPRLKLVTMAVR
jgi:hypothetical protein